VEGLDVRSYFLLMHQIQYPWHFSSCYYSNLLLNWLVLQLRDAYHSGLYHPCTNKAWVYHPEVWSEVNHLVVLDVADAEVEQNQILLA
jgi:hypothetical protein